MAEKDGEFTIGSGSDENEPEEDPFAPLPGAEISVSGDLTDTEAERAAAQVMDEINLTDTERDERVKAAVANTRRKQQNSGDTFVYIRNCTVKIGRTSARFFVRGVAGGLERGYSIAAMIATFLVGAAGWYFGGGHALFGFLFAGLAVAFLAVKSRLPEDAWAKIPDKVFPKNKDAVAGGVVLSLIAAAGSCFQAGRRLEGAVLMVIAFFVWVLKPGLPQGTIAEFVREDLDVMKTKTREFCDDLGLTGSGKKGKK